MALDNVSFHRALAGSIDRVDVPEGAAVLYPGPDATLLGEGPPPSHLIVLDGTWPQAKALYRDSPWLHDLPCVGIVPDRPSNYRIRKEPAEHCLSTIEAIEVALRAIEPETPRLDRLLDGFDAMIDRQIAELASRERNPRRVKRTSQKPRLRDVLHERWEDVVVLYAETSPVRGKANGRGIEVLQLAAVRPATGETFDELTAVREVPDAHLLEHMELDGDAIRSAPAFDTLAESWSSFARPGDIYVAWSHAGARTALAKLQPDATVVHLKPLYCNLRGPKTGRPDQILEREGLTSTPVAVRGRAGARLGNASVIADLLRNRRPKP